MNNHKPHLLLTASLLTLLAAPPAAAERIGADIVDGPSVNLLSYDNPYTDAFSSAGDGFQIYQRGASPSIPFALVDDSLSIFPADSLGIIGETDSAPFFGITDTVNGDTTGPVSASWVFDVSGASDIALSLDVAAMGDFETSDTLTVSYAFDGTAPEVVFEVVIDESASQDYTLEGGSVVTLADPATLDGVLLNNVLQTFSVLLEGSGGELTITLTANTNGGDEAFVIRNLTLDSDALSADVIAFDMLGSESLNLTAFNNPSDGAFSSAGDGFQKYRRGVSSSIPFSVLDDSLTTFPADTLGIIDDNNLDEFFGATDTENGDNSGPVSASWTFDVSGASDLGLSVDIGAMGDFESSDSFVFSYSIDGGPAQTLLSGIADEAASATYTLAGGASVTLNDPLTVDGIVLSNVLTTVSAALEGTGSSLTLTLTVQTDGGSEAMAFQNLLVLRNFVPPEPEVTDAEIYEIQGDGDASPLVGERVRTQANVVTAVGPEGFFMQTPESRSDGNVDTSDGIYVFTDAAPSVVPGDIVDVEGTIVEFFGFTEFAAGASVTLTGSGAALPAPVVLDATRPSPSLESGNCAIEFECWEGMRVEIASGTVTAPNQSFGSDPLAEVFIVASDARVFREPGIEFPGLAGLPVWDGNPEVFELDPDKLGLPNLAINAGSTFSASGVIGFEFGGYELWPTALEVQQATLPVAVRARDRAEFTVGSLNLFRLFDSVDDPADLSTGRSRDDVVIDPAEYAVRLDKLAAYVVDVLDAPEVLAVQEVESEKTLQDLADTIGTLAGHSYTSYLVEGNDVGTIDVGFLVRDSITVDAVTQIGKDEILAFDGSLLNDRPPLLLEARNTEDGSNFPLAIIVVHNRSLGGVDSASSGERVRAKRLAQAQSLASTVQALQSADPDIHLVVLGDFNAFEFSDGFVDVIGQIQGIVDPAESLLSGDDLVDPDLINLTNLIAEDERYSFIFGGSAQALDHALISSGLSASVRGYMYGRGNADAPRILIEDGSTPLRASDHDGLVVYLTKDRDADGVFDSLDRCPATAIPEAAPATVLPGRLWARGATPPPVIAGPVGRYRLSDSDFVFDIVDPSGRAPTYTTADTGGCSCSQIIDALHLGEGQKKFGCSRGIMRRWVRQITQ